MKLQENSFESRLREKVSGYFESKGIKKYADRRILIKAFVFMVLFLLAYSIILLSDNMPLLLAAYALLGLSNIFLSINIGHEAIHKCLGTEKHLNHIGKLAFSLAGVSPVLWGTRHLNSHHKHTNIPELDTDFQQSKLVRLEPGFPKSKFHRYQQYYIPVFYLLYTFHWTYIKDFKEAGSLNTRALALLVFNKVLYLALFFLIPLMVHHYNINIVYGFLFSYAVTGAFFGLFLIPIHINDYAQIQNKNAQARLGFTEQLASTPNFATANPVLNFILGGFNHHACHHLFPAVSHVHYPQLTKLIRELSADEHIVYHDLRYSQLLQSHFRHLKTLAQLP